MALQQSDGAINLPIQHGGYDGLMLGPDLPCRERMTDRDPPIAIELIGEMIAEAHQWVRAALAYQRAMEDAVQTLPLRIVLELHGVERARRAAEPVMGDDQRLLPGGVAASIDLRNASASIQQRVIVRLLAQPHPDPEPDGGTIVAIAVPQGGIYRFVQGDRRHADAAEMRDRPSRLAHVNLNSVDVEAQAAFYANALGFALTDRSKLMAFRRCNSDHHAVVLAQAQASGLNHIAFLLPD